MITHERSECAQLWTSNCNRSLTVRGFAVWLWEQSCCYQLRDRNDSSKNLEDAQLSSRTAAAKPAVVQYAFQPPVFSQRLTSLHLHSASKSQAKDSSVFELSLKGLVGGRNPSLGKRSCQNCKQKPKRCKRQRRQRSWQPEKNCESEWERSW